MANVKRHLRPGTVLVIGFLSIIIIGSLLLYLPLSRKEGAGTFLDCLFVSVSSVCVTGLTTVDIANTFTVFGRVVVAVLIQLGGLGFLKPVQPRRRWQDRHRGRQRSGRSGSESGVINW